MKNQALRHKAVPLKYVLSLLMYFYAFFNPLLRLQKELMAPDIDTNLNKNGKEKPYLKT